MADEAQNTLPPQYAVAAKTLEGMVRTRPLSVENAGQQTLADATISLGKGFNFANWTQGASLDEIEVTLTSPQLVNSATAEAASKAMLEMLNGIDAMRHEVILTSPKDYVEGVKKDMTMLMGEAKAIGIPGADLDFGQSIVFNTNISNNQIPDHGVTIIENPDKTQIRLQIAMNPDAPQEALATANAIADGLRPRTEEIKEAMIQHIKRKNYMGSMTPEQEAKLRAHKFDVEVQQQQNWTSVFVNITSLEQQAAAKAPGEKTMEPKDLQATNMLAQIPDAKQRAKLASRAILFEGADLKTPSSIFLKVAGSEDITNAVGKIMHYLGKAKPELAEKIEALRKENLFKRREQWNLPADQQEVYKRSARVFIDPKEPTSMKIAIPVKAGKADEIVQAIAALAPQAQTSDVLAKIGPDSAVVAEQPAAADAPTAADGVARRIEGGKIQEILAAGPAPTGADDIKKALSTTSGRSVA